MTCSTTREVIDLDDVFNDVTLQVRVVDAYRAAADLAAVQHQVVVLTAHLSTGRTRRHANYERQTQQNVIIKTNHYRVQFTGIRSC